MKRACGKCSVGQKQANTEQVLTQGEWLRLINSSLQLLWWLVLCVIMLEKRHGRQSDQPLYVPYVLCNGRSLTTSHQRRDSSNGCAADICM